MFPFFFSQGTPIQPSKPKYFLLLEVPKFTIPTFVLPQALPISLSPGIIELCCSVWLSCHTGASWVLPGWVGKEQRLPGRRSFLRTPADQPSLQQYSYLTTSDFLGSLKIMSKLRFLHHFHCRNLPALSLGRESINFYTDHTAGNCWSVVKENSL